MIDRTHVRVNLKFKSLGEQVYPEMSWTQRSKKLIKVLEQILYEKK